MNAAPYKTVILLTTGAGGRFRATARQLLRRGHHVVTVEGCAGYEAPRVLEAAGVQIVPGALEESDSLENILHRADAVVLVLQRGWKAVSTDDSVRPCGSVVDMAFRAGVRHLVLSTWTCRDPLSGSPRGGDNELERLVASSGLPHTLLRCAFPMELFADPKIGKLILPMIAGSLGRQTRLSMLAPEDAGWFAAEAVSRPARYAGTTLALAGDNPTIGEIQLVLEGTRSGVLPNLQIPSWALRLMNMDGVQRYLDSPQPCSADDIRQLRQLHPELRSLASWAREHLVSPPAEVG